MELNIIWHIAISMALGGIIGLERELLKKPAGLRTHMYIAGSATGLILLGTEIVQLYNGSVANSVLRADPMGIVQAIIVGVSFIGGGIIIKSQNSNQVQNLTTAASTLFTAVLGIAIAVNEFWLGIGMAVISLIINSGLGLLERKMNIGSGPQ